MAFFRKYFKFEKAGATGFGNNAYIKAIAFCKPVRSGNICPHGICYFENVQALFRVNSMHNPSGSKRLCLFIDNEPVNREPKWQNKSRHLFAY
jgi:hypothetical protein